MCLQVCRREKYKPRKTKEGRPRLEEAVYCRLNCASLKPFADTLILFCKGHNSKSTRPTVSWGLGLGMLSFEAGHAGASCAPAAGEDYCILLGLVSNVGIVLKWKHWLTLAQLIRENQKHKLQPCHDISDCVTYLILLSLLSPEETDLFLWIWCGGSDCELNTVRLLELT